MTVKKRLFLSNILMLIIPALVSILVILASGLLFMNIIYKQFMDETVRENNLTYTHKLLVKQSEEFLGGDKNIEHSTLYKTVEKYLKSNEMELEIYNGSGTVCRLGNDKTSKEVKDLISELRKMGGVGSISVNGSCVYGEKVTVDNVDYLIMIYNKMQIQESSFNETLVHGIMIFLCILIIVAVLVTNQFLTKFVFKKIERPLDVLTDGVNQIRDGNLDYRIEYDEDDEFKVVCDSFNDMAERLKISVEETQKNDQNRKELIAGISHDIRTPLTAVKAYIEGLIDGVASTPEMQKKYMKTILQKANDIDSLVDKLFLFSKLDLGNFPFYPEIFNVSAELSKVIERYKNEYSAEKLEIEFYSLSENDDDNILCDVVQFENAVSNIIENSIKYSDKEKTIIKVICESTEDRVAISIADNGRGVPEDSLEKMFDVFWRNDKSRNEPNKGSGLGLAITKKIWEHFDGEITAENILPTGLAVIMTIPKSKKEGEKE